MIDANTDLPHITVESQQNTAVASRRVTFVRHNVRDDSAPHYARRRLYVDQPADPGRLSPNEIGGIINVHEDLAQQLGLDPDKITITVEIDD